MAHFLLHCPSYMHERWLLKRHVQKKRKPMMLEALLGDPDLVIPLANYIDGTNHFSYSNGEHPQN